MAEIKLTIPDAIASRVLNAVTGSFGYTGAGGQTKLQFAKQHLADHLKQITADYEANLAASTAASTARQSAEQEITIS